jgi:hypothetical protein
MIEDEHVLTSQSALAIKILPKVILEEVYLPLAAIGTSVWKFVGCRDGLDSTYSCIADLIKEKRESSIGSCCITIINLPQRKRKLKELLEASGITKDIIVSQNDDSVWCLDSPTSNFSTGRQTHINFIQAQSLSNWRGFGPDLVIYLF